MHVNTRHTTKTQIRWQAANKGTEMPWKDHATPEEMLTLERLQQAREEAAAACRAYYKTLSRRCQSRERQARLKADADG